MPQHLVHALGGLLHVGQDVGVGVHSLAYVGVPEHLLDHSGVHVGLEHEGGSGVPRTLMAVRGEAPAGAMLSSRSRKWSRMLAASLATPCIMRVG